MCLLMMKYFAILINTFKDFTLKFVRQSGGRGQYGHVKLTVEPLERGKGFEFESKVVGGRIPKEFIPSIEKGR